MTVQEVFSVALPQGTLVADYRIEKVLGEGGFGLTYLVFDEQLHKHFALKEYLPADFSTRVAEHQVQPRTSASKNDFDWGLEAFINEARTLAKFHNPHLVPVHRFLTANGTAYIVMEYVQGRTLTETVKDLGQLSEAEVRAILLPIMDGLQDVHDADILHRDIKPDNILIRDNGTPVLIDFGAARQAMANKSRSITTILTPGYAPLEQYASRAKVGPWSDIYAIAAVAYYCLTQQTPMESSERVLEDDLPPLVSLSGLSASAGFLAALDQGLALRPEQRPTDLAHFVALLNQTGGTVIEAVAESASVAKETILVQPLASEHIDYTAVEGTEIEPLAQPELVGQDQQEQSHGFNLSNQPTNEPGAQQTWTLSRGLAAIVCFLLLMAVWPTWVFIDIKLEQHRAEKLAKIEQQKRAQLLDQLLAGNTMVRIEPGSFQMGSSKGNKKETPAHMVTFSKAFALSQYEVTFAQFDQFAEATGRKKPNDEGWGRGQLPVFNVSWMDAQDYALWLSEQTGLLFRLPTEAEWEYAARAGTKTHYPWGNTVDCSKANYKDNCLVPGVIPVGQYQPNAWGLYDMQGNVREWVQDCWNKTYVHAPTDGSAWLTGDCSDRPVRGGAWFNSSNKMRSAYRGRKGINYDSDNTGFRLAQDLAH